MTIGIKPTEPATGYGYIHVGQELPTPPGAKKTKTTFFKAEQFVEKPNFETALEYVNSGQYRWNAGMFVWSFVTITNGLQKHQPEMFAACQRWFKVANNPAKLAKVLAKEYPDIKKISIDFALMEKAQNVIVADGAFEWDDLGSWTGAGAASQAGRRGQLRRGGFHPRGRARGTSSTTRGRRTGRPLPWSACATRFWCRRTTPCCWRTRARRKRSRNWSGDWARTRG